MSLPSNPTLTETHHPALHYERMIGDRVRMASYRDAIAQVVKAGDVVADLGTGLGILAMMAAQAGAGKVYAIDLNPRSLWMARLLAKENGVEDKIEFMEADAQQCDLPEKVNVIVSELIAEFGCEEGVYETVSRFAAKNLAPGGRCIPSQVNTFLVPVEYTDSFRHGWCRDNAGLDLTLPMRMPFASEAVKFYLRGRQKDLSSAQAVECLSFSGDCMIDTCRPTELTLEFTLNTAGILHGFVGYFEVALTPGNRHLSNYPPYEGCHWENWNWPTNPHIEVQSGDTITVNLQQTFKPGSDRFIKASKDTASGWEPQYGWSIEWEHCDTR